MEDLSKAQQQLNDINSAIRHRDNYLSTVQDESDDCTSILEELDSYEIQRQKILDVYRLCQKCEKLAEKEKVCAICGT